MNLSVENFMKDLNLSDINVDGISEKLREAISDSDLQKILLHLKQKKKSLLSEIKNIREKIAKNIHITNETRELLDQFKSNKYPYYPSVCRCPYKTVCCLKIGGAEDFYKIVEFRLLNSLKEQYILMNMERGKYILDMT